MKNKQIDFFGKKWGIRNDYEDRKKRYILLQEHKNYNYELLQITGCHFHPQDHKQEINSLKYM